MARQFCRDRTELTLDQAKGAANFVSRVQELNLAYAIEKVIATLPESPAAVIYSGSGEFLTRRLSATYDRNVKLRHQNGVTESELRLLSDASQFFLADAFSAETATAACAFALARLAVERNALLPTDDAWQSILG